MWTSVAGEGQWGISLWITLTFSFLFNDRCLLGNLIYFLYVDTSDILDN